MNNLNSVLLEGNLTADPEVKDIDNIKLCTFTIVSNRYYKKDGDDYQKEVSFFDVECSGKLADVCKQYLKKGRCVRIIGRLRQECWAEASNKPGPFNSAVIRKTKIIVMAEQVEFKPAFKSRDYLEVVR